MRPHCPCYTSSVGVIFFYIAILSFFSGVALRAFFNISYDWLLVCLFVSVLAALVWSRRNIRNSFLLSLALVFVVLGVVRFDVELWQDSGQMVDEKVGKEITLVGEVVREPDVRETTTHVHLRLVDQDQVVLLYAPRHADVDYGDVLSVQGKLELPKAFETDLGRTFNYPGYLKSQGVDFIMFRPDFSVAGKDQGNQILNTLLKAKKSLMGSIETAITEPQAGLGEGLLLGVKSALGSEWENIFRRTGIIHIVVLSGYNVMLVVTFVLAILSYLCGLRTRLLFGLLAIAAFALTVGLSATVLRASLMAGLILVAHATGRNYEVIRALFLAGLVMVFINPYLLVFDPGFQLSFLATLGLILVGPLIEKRIMFVPSVIGLRSFLVATLATQLCVLPFLLYQIGEFSVVAVLVNVLVLPMVPVAMLLTFLTGLVGLAHSGAATAIGFLAYLSLSYILVVAEWFSSLPFAAYEVPAFHWLVMVVSYVVLGWLFWKFTNSSTNPADEKAGDLSGWTIVEEKEEDSGRYPESSDVPVFFR